MPSFNDSPRSERSQQKFSDAINLNHAQRSVEIFVVVDSADARSDLVEGTIDI